MGVLERAQQYGVRVAGEAVTRQLPQKSRARMIQWTDDVKWAMREHNLQYVRGINERERQEMIKVLQWSVDRHQKPDEIAAAFLDSGLQMTAARAERIAVTEGTRAAAMGVMLAANDFPYEMQKHWVSSGDNRVRVRPYSHNISSADVRELMDVWFNGEEIMFPGDPRCSAGNVVNCRCMLAISAKRDAEGNLIPKRVFVSNRQLLVGVVVGAAVAAIASVLNTIFGD
jgi:hypothetical protein